MYCSAEITFDEFIGKNLKHLRFVAAELWVSAVFLCLYKMKWISWGFGHEQFHNFTLSFWELWQAICFEFFITEALRHFCLLFHSKKIFFFSCVKPGEKKEWKYYFSHFFFSTKTKTHFQGGNKGSSVSFCNTHFGHKRQKCTTAHVLNKMKSTNVPPGESYLLSLCTITVYVSRLCNMTVMFLLVLICR